MRRPARDRPRKPASARLYDLPDFGIIDMGDFAGGMLKYSAPASAAAPDHRRRLCQDRKLAAGAGDLHSGRSQVDNGLLAQALSDLGATAA